MLLTLSTLALPVLANVEVPHEEGVDFSSFETYA
jgi:hypothetical protein